MKRLLILFIVLTTSSGILADTKTWDRGAGTDNWSDADNWNPNGVPGSGDAAVLALIGGNINIYVDVSTSCASIDFPDGVSSDLNLNINAGITLNVSGTITIPQAGGSGTTNQNTLAIGSATLNAGSISFTNAAGPCRHQVTISTGTVTVTGNIISDGNPGENSPTISISGSGLLQVGGNLFNSLYCTLITVAGSTVEFNGTGAQTVGHHTYNNIKMNGGGTKTLDGFTQVYGTFTLTSGKIITTSANLLAIEAGASVTGGSASSFVEGPMRYTVTTGGITSKTYPIGKGSEYRPIALNMGIYNGGFSLAYFTAEVFNSAPTSRTLPGTLSAVSSVRYWNVIQNVIDPGGVMTFSGIMVAVGYGSDDGVTDPTNLRIAKDDGSGGWIDLGGTGSGTPSGSILSTVNFTSFSDFCLANASGGSNPVPVELISFTAFVNHHMVQLVWLTETEVKNYGFEIERSQKSNVGKDWVRGGTRKQQLA